MVRREINWLFRRNKMCHSAENDSAFVVLIVAIIMAVVEWKRERKRKIREKERKYMCVLEKENDVLNIFASNYIL